jgi:hypothetical protein
MYGAAYALLLENLAERPLGSLHASQSKPDSMAFSARRKGQGKDSHSRRSGGLHLYMESSHSDARVIFRVTGDLAHKRIFPALYAMVKRGALKVPVIGVAFPKWSLTRLHKRVTDSIRRSGGIDNQRALHQLLSLLNICWWGLQRQWHIYCDQRCPGQGTAPSALSRYSARSSKP